MREHSEIEIIVIICQFTAIDLISNYYDKNEVDPFPFSVWLFYIPVKMLQLKIPLYLREKKKSADIVFNRILMLIAIHLQAVLGQFVGGQKPGQCPVSDMVTTCDCPTNQRACYTDFHCPFSKYISNIQIWWCCACIIVYPHIVYIF